MLGMEKMMEKRGNSIVIKSLKENKEKLKEQIRRFPKQIVPVLKRQIYLLVDAFNALGHLITAFINIYL